MGSLGFDIEAKEKTYRNLSFSSVEDIYDILWMLDMIIEGYNEFNVEALATKVDFLDAVEKIESPVLDMYIDIQSGTYPLSLNDYNKEIVEVISERLNKSLEDCETELLDSIELIISHNYRNWFHYYLNNYRGKFLSKNKSYESPFKNLEGWEDIDFKRKYLWKKNVKPKEEYPEELNELLELRHKNNNKIKKLELQGRKDLLKRYYRERIRIDEDITEMKKSFGIEIKGHNQYGRTENRMAFNDELNYEGHESSFSNSVMDSLAYHKVLEIADTMLTNKQQIIFYLYFENNLIQSEIAEILGDDQRNITNDIKRIIQKIRKNM